MICNYLTLIRISSLRLRIFAYVFCCVFFGKETSLASVLR